LQKMGAKVDIVDNGKEAIKKASESTPYDLILMDIEMPILNGLVATSTLRSRHYPNPIVALTAHSTDRVKNDCKNAGFSGFLVKPISGKTLKDCIKTHCDPNSIG